MLRLDAHVHVFDRGVLERLRPVALADGLTHYVAILDDLSLTGSLHEAGATGLPFQWVHDPENATLREDVAGYKIHPREPLQGGAPFRLRDASARALCARIAPTGRPLLCHTDADEPGTCALPMLAGLARGHPDGTFIAAHAGVFAGPYFQESQGREYSPDRWKTVAETALRENIDLLLEIPNLYADTTLFALDDPARGPDPDLRLRLFARAVGALGAAQRRALAGKLFIGTDFPCFWREGDLRSTVAKQVDYMKEAFGRDFDEERMVRAFFDLLPSEFAARG